ncbi:MAG: phage portal protein, partial [Pseudomonadales bacterium]|nr:phage portal protein [Pseudomonadales bacterium]
GGKAAAPAPQPAPEPRDAGHLVVRNDAGRLITVQELDDYLQGVSDMGLDERVTPNQAMTVTAVQTCVRLIGGGVSNTPIKVMREIDEKTREEAKGSEIWNLLRRRPNPYMRPRQFFRMSCAHVMLRGNFYALKVKGANGHVRQLIPLDPDQCRAEKLITGQVVYKYVRKSDGKTFVYNRDQILHLYLLTLDGVTGVTPIHYASMTIAGARDMERHGQKVFKNGARVSGLLSTEKRLGKEGRQNLREAMDEYRAGGEHEGGELVLEDGVTYERMAMTSQDAQWIEARKLGKADIYEIYGIPLHMTALADKQSNWGTGVEQHNKQFMQWVLEDYYGMWEEAINTDIIGPDAKLEAMFDRSSLLRGDMKAQSQRDQTDLQWGINSPNEIRQRRGENPRPGGDIYYPPPNMSEPDGDDGNEGDDPPPANDNGDETP